MKIDLSAKLLDLSGQPMQQKLPEGKSKPLTLGAVIVGAVSSAAQGINQAQSLKRFKLAVLARKGGKQELTEDMLDEIRGAVHQRYQGDPILFGRVCELVGEPKAPKPASPKR